MQILDRSNHSVSLLSSDLEAVRLRKVITYGLVVCLEHLFIALLTEFWRKLPPGCVDVALCLEVLDVSIRKNLLEKFILSVLHDFGWIESQLLLLHRLLIIRFEEPICRVGSATHWGGRLRSNLRRSTHLRVNPNGTFWRPFRTT